jgi:trigger factor
MRVEAQAVSSVIKDVVVELPVEAVQRELDEYYRDLARRARVPGFRPGKVPRSVLERRFGMDVNQDVASRLVARTTAAALVEAKVEPVAEPVVQRAPVAAGTAFRYTLRCEVWPEIVPEGYDELEANAAPISVGEEDVARELERLREQRAELRPVAGRTIVQKGDHITVSYEALVDGKPFEGSIAKDRELEVGAGHAVPGFEEALAGAEVGRRHTFEIVLPADIGDKKLNGKTAVFHATVAEIKERFVPALDDAFAKDVAPNLAGLDALRAELRQHLERQAEARGRRAVHEQLVDRALERNTFDVPASLVESELEDQMREAKLSLAMMGIRPEQIAVDDRRMRQELRPRAERRARQRVLLAAIAVRESIEVGDDEVEARIRAHAEATGQALSKVRQNFSKGRARERLRVQIREEKVLDLLRSRARIKELSPEEPPASAAST